MKSIELVLLNTNGKKITVFLNSIMFVSESGNNTRIGLVGGDHSVITVEANYNTVLYMINEAK